MLIPAVWRALVDAGVDLVPVDAQHVELRSGRVGARLRLHSSRRPLSPSGIAAVIDRYQEPGLLVLPAATVEAQGAARRAGWSWLVVDERNVYGELRIAGRTLRIGTSAHEQRASRGKSGPVAWGSLTITRHLLQRPAVTQKALAAGAHVSQPRVSQALKALADQQLVERSRTGWTVRDFDRLLTWWLAEYPGPGGISTYWYGLAAPMNQARAVIQLLSPPSRTERSDGRSPVVSGDVAADLIAPWRSPSRAVVYAREGADLTEASMTPTSLEEATLELIVPQDPGVWPSAWLKPPRDAALPLADPIQVLWDVRRSPGPDSPEAAARLWEKLREHWRANEPISAS